MINKKIITTFGQQIEINSVIGTDQWVLVYSDNVAHFCGQLLSGSSVVESPSDMFEGTNFEECQAEANRLNLINASSLRELVDKFIPPENKI